MAGGRRPLGVAVAGFGWMGRAHTQAYARVLHHFPELPPAPALVAVADEAPDRAEQAAAQFGWATATRNWRDPAGDLRVQAVSVTAPNFLHREIGVAMAEAGKHRWIEKPVGLTSDDAGAVADAVRRAGVQGTVGFNYRNARRSPPPASSYGPPWTPSRPWTSPPGPSALRTSWSPPGPPPDPAGRWPPSR